MGFEQQYFEQTSSVWNIEGLSLIKVSNTQNHQHYAVMPVSESRY